MQRKSSDNKQRSKTEKYAETGPKNEPETRLNKFIAASGYCSRRKADELIAQGAVKVNGEVVTTLGHKINPEDKVTVNSKKIEEVKEKVYILLNKPKGFITTTKDTHERKTVLDLIQGATQERVFPVGRLDRNTTGVLLLTNDGDLTKLLTHPSSNIAKIYKVNLDKPVTKADMEKLMNGVELEDGIMHVDEAAYVEEEDKTVVGIEIHSGKKRVVRRLFDRLGYEVLKLDRVVFANLDKYKVPRGKWRHLSMKEVKALKHLARQKRQV